MPQSEDLDKLALGAIQYPTLYEMYVQLQTQRKDLLKEDFPICHPLDDVLIIIPILNEQQ